MSNNYKIELTIKWLQEKVNDAGAKGLIVGISGGIDSAVCAYLIKKAFPETSFGLLMPCDSNEQDRFDGLTVVSKSQLDYQEIDLTREYLKMSTLIEKSIQTHQNKVLDFAISRANLKARLRMSTLYFVANALNYLVVGTDNLAEIYTGYFTKYGDGGVDLLPLANLTKREVRAWAYELGVPEEIITKAPSAGLWPGQRDEDELGTSYDIIDDYLQGKDIPVEDKKIIEKLHQRSEHKRKMPQGAPNFNLENTKRRGY